VRLHFFALIPARDFNPSYGSLHSGVSCAVVRHAGFPCCFRVSLAIHAA
jgi:hypothetical protein